MNKVIDKDSGTGDPQKAPLPQMAYVPSRKAEIFWAVINFTEKLLWVAIKLAVILILFVVAFIGVLVWRA